MLYTVNPQFLGYVKWNLHFIKINSCIVQVFKSNEEIC